MDKATSVFSPYTPISDRSRRWPLTVLDGGRVALRYAGSTELLRADSILLARSSGNYTTLVTDSGEHSLRAPLTFVVQELRGFGLVRIHRAAAVNMEHVRRLVGRGRRWLVVVLDTGVEVEVGRTFQRLVRARLGARTQWTR